LIILGILIVVGFFITDPDLGDQMLVELGLKEPTQQGYLLSGLVEAQVTQLSSENGGRVTIIPVAEGVLVESGELLVSLDTALMMARLEVAEAQLEIALANLEMVEAGPRVVDFAVAEASILHAQAVKDAAMLSLIDARVSRPESLRDEQTAIAQAQLDQAQANLRIAESILEALQSGAPDSSIESATAAVAIAEAEVARQQTMIEKQDLHAPKDAVVLDLHLLPGETALPGQALLSLADLREVEVTVFVPEFDLNWTNLGDIVEVKFDAYLDRSYVGVVIDISDRAEFTPRSIQTPEERVILVYPVTVRIANPGGDLKPGLTVDVIFGGES
jgi:HlyD family secretion protein